MNIKLQSIGKYNRIIIFDLLKKKKKCICSRATTIVGVTKYEYFTQVMYFI